MTLIHSLSMTTPDDPAYEAKPSDWNAAHAQTITIVGNTAGASTISGTNIVFSAGPNATISVNGNTLVFSGGAGAAGNTGYLSDSANTASLGTIVLSNANGFAWGLNAQTLTASYTQAVQTNQTEGFYAVGNTTQNSSTTLDARTVSFGGRGIVTVGYSNGTVQISATEVPQTNQSVGLYALGNTTQNSSTTLDARTLSFNGLGIVTVGYSNGSIQISATEVAQTAQTVGLYGVGNTTQNSSTTLDARTISYGGRGDITVGFSNGTVQISGSQSNQQMTLFATSNTTQSSTGTTNASSLIFAGAGAASVGITNGSVVISVPSVAGIALYDGANSITSGTARFTNANGVSFTFNGQTISASVAAQTNQSVGLYALGNTTQNSSTTLDARTLSFNGLGIVTMGYSNGSIQVSATQSAQTAGLYALGNTTQNSSTTLDARTMSFNALGAMTMGYSNGSIQVSAPATSSLVGTSGISISTAGSTISVMLGSAISNFPDPALLLGQYSTGQQGNGSVRFWPISVSNVLVIDRGIAFVHMSISTSSNSSHAGSISIACGIFTKNASTLSAFTTGSTAHSWTNTSNNSTSVLTGLRALSCPLSATLTPGNYWLGVWTRTSTANANWFTASNLLLAPPNTAYSGHLGSASTVTFQPMLGWGEFSATSSTLNNSYAFSHISGTGQAMLARPILNLVNGTV